MSKREKNDRAVQPAGAASLITEILLSVIAILAVSFLPTLYLYTANYGSLKLSSLMGSVYLFAAAGLGLFALLRLILRRRPYLAGCFATAVVFFLVNFSLVSSPVKLVFRDYVVANVVSIVLTALLILGAWFLFRFLCRNPQNGHSVLLVLCIVFVGLVAFNAIQIPLKANAKAAAKAARKNAPVVTATPAPPTPKPTPHEEVVVEIPADVPNAEMAAALERTPVPTSSPTPEPTPTPTPTPFAPDNPNIYVLVFDEYGSMGAMEQYYNYDCTPMREFMRSAGINWTEHSYSMTSETKLCMTDLNMMDFVSYKKGKGTLVGYRRKSALKDVFGTQLGYTLYQCSENPAWFGYISSLRTRSVKDTFKKTTMDGVESHEIVKNQSILGAFESILGALTPTEEIQLTGESESLKKYGYYSTAEIRSSSAFKKNRYHSDANNIMDILDFFEDESNFGKTADKHAIFSYIRCPHVPFFFDEYGQIQAFGQRMNWNQPDFYLGQYKYITKHMVTIFKTIISNDPDSIIVMLSDHGVRTHNQSFCDISPKGDRWIFGAVYYCGEPLDIEGLAAVNIMRLIATKLGVELEQVHQYVTVDSAEDLSDVVWP